MRFSYLLGVTMVFFNQIRAGWTAFAHREALGTLGFGRRLQIGLKVLAGDFEGIDSTVKGLNRAKELVRLAASTFEKTGKLTQDFEGFRTLLFASRAQLGADEQLDRKSRLALFDAVWTATLRKKKLNTVFKRANGSERSVNRATIRHEFRQLVRDDRWERMEWFHTMQEAR